MGSPAKHHHKAQTVQQQPVQQPVQESSPASQMLLGIGSLVFWILIIWFFWKLKWQRREYRWRKQGKAWAEGVAQGQREEALRQQRGLPLPR